MLLSLIVVCALIVLNGLFALAELALVSARRARLQALVDAGRRGAASALALQAEPGRFLSAVQIGITLVGIVNGAFSAETLGESATAGLVALGLTEGTAATIGFTSVILVVTYLSVIVGELVPKSLALRNPEAIACLVAPAMTQFARLAAPAVWLLNASTQLVMRLLGRADTQARVTDEEIRSVIAEAESEGVVERQEKEMIAGVMRLADRRVTALMTPRKDVKWLDLNARRDAQHAQLQATPHAFLPAAEGDLDAVVGIVRVREALAAIITSRTADPRKNVHAAIVVPENAVALDAIDRMREAEIPVVFVHDEYGHFEGMITPGNILETITGDFIADTGTTDPEIVAVGDHRWRIAGVTPIDEVADLMSLTLPAKRDYATLAGFMLDHFKRLPQPGDRFDANGWRFEVVAMDGRRIALAEVQRAEPRHRAGAG